ncbi:putative endopeptidase [Metamycoplasma subdolum]|uniref:Putative endopeptidase n=1 Tax=Metamycoplasma subdolum TaxID=92407 RepID=A0A3M0A1L3_9BACT|nr:M13 family metallopeptidase [Metamycoplasma subdolum]RMA78526.1 putative endopeptidase [Metamycoplasma subdolum]WPB50458.1 M13 family metallopeptidase [Metamycoplasma subdolum]
MNKKLIKKDFFEAVNGVWLKNAKIPEHQIGWGSFYQLGERITRLKKSLLNKWCEDQSDIKNEPILKEMIKFYKIVKNWQQRRIDGVKPIYKFLDLVSNINSWKDFENNFDTLTTYGFDSILNFGINQDFKDNSLQVLWLDDGPTILPEKGDYQNEEKKKPLLAVWSSMVKKLLVKIIKDENKADDLIKKALEYDELIAKFVKSAVEKANYIESYNVYEVEKINNQKFVNISKIINDLIGTNVEKVVVVNPKFVEALPTLINENTFEMFKAHLFIRSMLTMTGFLDNSTRKIAAEYRMAIAGLKKPYAKERVAIETTLSTFSMPFGIYYGKTYFGKEAKADVERMVQKFIKIYKTRLQNNNWLSEATKEKAILKLSKLGVHVGYPTEMRDYYNDLKVKEYEDSGLDLLSNAMEFRKIVNKYYMKQYMQPVNKNLWSMSPATVNAYFAAEHNHIVFPAAILNPPFYSTKYSSSKNYGGIGTVIAHEISHAFDNNGAKFDETGKMANWWTDEDKQNFESKTQAMIDLFEGKETEFGKCNGKLTVSENIADAGGVSCALEAAKSEPDFSAKDFYINFATIWRAKYRKQFAEYLLRVDVHAPAKLRANIQIMNSDDFYTTFDITKKDGMYLPLEKRVKIW